MIECYVDRYDRYSVNSFSEHTFVNNVNHQIETICLMVLDLNDRISDGSYYDLFVVTKF